MKALEKIKRYAYGGIIGMMLEYYFRVEQLWIPLVVSIILISSALVDIIFDD